jgi:hypothetical protein
VEIVDQVSAARDQDAFSAQLGKHPTDLEMKGRRLGLIDTELDDRDIGIGIDVAKHGPSPVIEPPARGRV